MRKIITLILALSILSAAVAMPVTVSAETTLAEAAEIYAEKLSEFISLNGFQTNMSNQYTFALAYIDEDNIPEMIVNASTAHVSNPEVYSVKSGILTETTIPSGYGYLEFSSNNNIIRTGDMHFGYGYTLFGYLDNSGSYVTMKQFDDNTGAILEETGDTYLYGIDGTKVSEEYYKQKFSEITDNYEWTVFAPLSNENCFEASASNIEDMKKHPKKYIIGYDYISVYLDDEEIDFGEYQNAVMINGSVMVPMRTIFEALGAEVSWEGDTKTIHAQRDMIYINMTIGNNIMTIVNPAKTETKTVTLSVPPQLAGGYTVVPVRAVSEALNTEVSWEEATKSVCITNPEIRRALLAVNNDEKEVQNEAFKESAVLIKQALTKLGFSDTDITHYIEDEYILRESRFERLLQQTFSENDDNDISIVYYVGHSVYSYIDEYGNMSGFKTGLINKAGDGYLEFGDFYELVKNNVKGAVLILYDGCFAGTLIDEADLVPRVKIIGASASNEESYDYYISRLDDTFQLTQIFIKLDNSGERTLFSYALYDGVVNNRKTLDKNSDNSITFKELFNYISDKLPVLAEKAGFWPEETSGNSGENAKKKNGSDEQETYHQTAVCYPTGDSTELFIY